MLRPAAVSTMLTPTERLRVDAAGTGLYSTVHRDSIDDVVRDVRDHQAHAVVVSVARCCPADAARIAARVASIVRDYPRVRAIALLTAVEGPASTGVPAAVLSLGRSGVHTLVDARHPGGWAALREALAPRDDALAELEGAALSRLGEDLRGAPVDCLRYFTILFTAAPAVTTVRRLALALDVGPTTLVSRFARRALPSPKRYLATARLARAAALFEDPASSVASVAMALEYSSPQSFGRHLRLHLALTPRQFRDAFDGAAMLDRFRQGLVLPHVAALRAFSPLAPTALRRQPAGRPDPADPARLVGAPADGRPGQPLVVPGRWPAAPRA